MARLSKWEKHTRMAIAVLGGVALGLLLILGIRAVLYYAENAAGGLFAWLLRSAPVAMPPSEGAATSSLLTPLPSPVSQLSTLPAAPAPAPALPSAVSPSSSLSSATYTELFSGTGFDDASDTTAYEDYTATDISLVPNFAVSAAPAGAAFAPPPPSSSAGGPAAAGAIVRESTSTDASGDPIYVATIPAFPGLVVTSTYPGVLRFGYDVAAGRTLIVYAAYESRVLEMGPVAADGGAVGVINDYSSRFGSRMFSGRDYRSLGTPNPVIFSQDGAWWIFSGEGSNKPHLVKLYDGAVVDYAPLAFPNLQTIFAAPGPTPHEIYVSDSANGARAGGKLYILTDNGFRPGPVQWVSSKINQWDGNVAQGEILGVEGSTGSVAAPAPQYYLSNNGGLTWFAATPGTPLTFATAGGDFRYKVVLPLDATNTYITPWVSAVRLEYWVQRSGQ